MCTTYIILTFIPVSCLIASILYSYSRTQIHLMGCRPLDSLRGGYTVLGRAPTSTASWAWRERQEREASKQNCIGVLSAVRKRTEGVVGVHREVPSPVGIVSIWLLSKEVIPEHLKRHGKLSIQKRLVAK